jgi:hypothetical protein
MEANWIGLDRANTETDDTDADADTGPYPSYRLYNRTRSRLRSSWAAKSA